MRDEDDEAVGGRVEDADDVARAAVPGHPEAVVPDPQPRRPEPPLHTRVRASDRQPGPANQCQRLECLAQAHVVRQ